MRVVSYKPVRGYAKYLVHEWSKSDGKGGFVMRYIYEVPDADGAELVKAGKVSVDNVR